jgi:hypothetical protein
MRMLPDHLAEHVRKQVLSYLQLTFDFRARHERVDGRPGAAVQAGMRMGM